MSDFMFIIDRENCCYYTDEDINLEYKSDFKILDQEEDYFKIEGIYHIHNKMDITTKVKIEYCNDIIYLSFDKYDHSGFIAFLK